MSLQKMELMNINLHRKNIEAENSLIWYRTGSYNISSKHKQACSYYEVWVAQSFHFAEAIDAC
jgi:hypothetical protein